jgi:hypothetical protein
MGGAMVDVFTAVGALVERLALQSGELDVADLPAGLYALRFMEKGRPITLPFIKR